MTDTEAGTPLTTCGHPFPCAPSGDGQCDHVDGNGVHQGYAYRCLLVPHGNTRHFHDRRPVAREWFERSTGTHAILADATRSRPATDPAGLDEQECAECGARCFIKSHQSRPAADPDACVYECPFTREGHKAHDVDHEFVPATDPAGLDEECERSMAGLICDTHRWFWPSLADRCNGWIALRVARLAVADGPGPATCICGANPPRRPWTPSANGDPCRDGNGNFREGHGYVADGPGPEERVREYMESHDGTWTYAGIAAAALSRPLPVHREESSR